MTEYRRRLDLDDPDNDWPVIEANGHFPAEERWSPGSPFRATMRFDNEVRVVDGRSGWFKNGSRSL